MYYKNIDLIGIFLGVYIIINMLDVFDNNYQILEDCPYRIRATCLFKEPIVTPLKNQPDFKCTVPDEEVLFKSLILTIKCALKF